MQAARRLLDVALARARDADGPLGGLTVLAVDDDSDARHLLGQWLTHVGARVVVADDGRQALDSLALLSPDVILLDLRMPHLDGLDVARRVRADARWADVPIIALTAFGEPTDFRSTWEIGFDAHLVKPVELDRLVDVVLRVVTRRRGGETTGRCTREPDRPSG